MGNLGTQHLGVTELVTEEVVSTAGHEIVIKYTTQEQKFTLRDETIAEKNVLDVEVYVYEHADYGLLRVVEDKHTACRYSTIEEQWTWSVFGRNETTGRDTFKNGMTMTQAHLLVLSLVKKYTK